MALFGVAIPICGHRQDINPVHSRVLPLTLCAGLKQGKHQRYSQRIKDRPKDHSGFRLQVARLIVLLPGFPLDLLILIVSRLDRLALAQEICHGLSDIAMI